MTLLLRLSSDTAADRVVPPSGYTARLTGFTAAAMAFLAVFAVALSLASGRLADRWQSSLAQTATIRISAPAEQMTAQTEAVLAVLRTTPGVASARVMDDAEQRALLEPWFGPDLPVEALPLPRLVEITEDSAGFDAAGLRMRLAGEAPGAVLDDHTRWREPLVAAADRLRMLGLTAVLVIAGATAAMITLAANASLAANAQVIRVLRLVGARDTYIARAFVRRFTRRALAGAAAGTAAGMLAIALLPEADAAGAFLTGLSFRGAGWLWPLTIPPLAAIVAFAATRAAAFRVLRGLM
ncbi:cell division protein FtsX [Alkalilacustris brevis]|uniref:cell division protein FtsX n=1 Tax=Alkalilacustris brevis TaxID=2026338 RepID=UPI000E0DD216|nr:cell division protein FtsX [Alkalilacustris brevis]